MSNKKQTAVEWLVSNIYTFQKEIEAGNEHLKSKIEQAKAMEQVERMYSEEEVIEIVEKSRATGLTAEYLIEQLKHKQA